MKDAFARRPLFFASLALAAGIFAADASGLPLWNEFFPGNHVSRFTGTHATVRGIVVSEPEVRANARGERRVSFALAVESLLADGKPSRVMGRVQVYARGVDAPAYGDTVVAKGELTEPEGRRNPGGYDARRHLFSRGVRAVLYAEKGALRVAANGGGNPFRSVAIRVKKTLVARLENDFAPRDAAFLEALFFGEKTHLDESVKELFLRTGTLHVLAVSGFNVGFLAACVLLTFGFLPVHKRAGLCAALAAVWAYCLVVGWQAPVVRATLMATLVLTARLTGRKADTLNLAGFAALAILAWEPRQLFDAGFTLSFVAVAGLAALVPRYVGKTPAEGPAAPALRYGRELFYGTLAATLATLPVAVRAFHIVSPLGLVANLVVVPLVSFVFFAGFLYFLTAWWLPPALSILAFLMHAAIKLSLEALFRIERLPGACVAVGDPGPLAALALGAGVLWFAFDPRIRLGWVRALASALWVACVFLSIEAGRFAPRPFSVTFLDVGQGDCAYVEFPEGGNMLVDAGRGGDSDKGRRVVVPFLRARGVRTLDLVVATHPQDDHIGGFPAVFGECRVNHFLHAGTPYGTAAWRRCLAAAAGSATLIARRGNNVEGFRAAKISVLHPAAAGVAKDVNDESVVLRVVSRGMSVLLTGDAGEPAMAEIAASGEPARCHVLKVPHHGAALGPSGVEFVRRASPSVSVISCGRKNAYGHPRQATLAALEAVPGGATYRTDLDGAVSVSADEKAIRVALPR